MGASKYLFIRMREEEYMEIPEIIREAHLRDKIYSTSVNDFDTLMQDKLYSDLHKTYKETKTHLEERAYQIRENNRKKSK